MEKDKEKPNILFIMTDQQRFDYISCAGTDFVNTPNIDRIAKRGMRFTNCFTNSPLCAPARIGLATGLQPCRVGALDNLAYLPLNAPTYYQRLRDHGYQVGCVGKLDLAKPLSFNGRNGDRPCLFGWGFTHPVECEGKMHAGKSEFPLGPYGYYLQKKGLYKRFHNDYVERRGKGWIVGASHDSKLSKEDFEDTYIGRRAVRWIEEISGDFPWHLFVSFAGPHDPFDPPTEFSKKYKNIKMPEAVKCDMEGKPNWVKKKQILVEDEENEHIRQQYCAAIELIDEQIGLILDKLEEKGILDKTYIIFSSDHGEMLGDLGLYQKIVPYDPSIRIPLIISGPRIAQGVISDAMVELIDINPTICELAGVSAREEMDAKSFAGIVFGETHEHREDIVTRLQQYRCIRTKKHKLIQNFNEKNELYDLENDPNELNNIIDENRGLEKQLLSRLIDRYMEGKWLW
ncbi:MULTISPECIES: sulfatase family protein [Clostridium]|uniref:sulfatase family protein n=1 Tax=Clostridium TaxID=1485 RepID=UPI00156E9080|nr:sulfatase-like hydrolase/transferase [Clostridium beijerinckii]NRT71442.1 choline-sulfatase [Clostridium beijerinckii]